MSNCATKKKLLNYYRMGDRSNSFMAEYFKKSCHALHADGRAVIFLNTSDGP